MARQLASSTSTPCSLRVGISMPATRSGAEIASARNSPDWIWPAHSL